MSKVFTLGIDPAANNKALIELEKYRQRLYTHKISMILSRVCERLRQIVAEGYAGAEYKGPKDVEVTVEQIDEDTYSIVATGETVLILEFGAGVTYYGAGHELADELGFGPGTYPGQTHALTGKGWYLPKEKGGGHTYGNPPSKTMYNAVKTLREELPQIVREVFAN
jgi:hypothetical protein